MFYIFYKKNKTHLCFKSASDLKGGGQWLCGVEEAWEMVLKDGAEVRNSVWALGQRTISGSCVVPSTSGRCHGRDLVWRWRHSTGVLAFLHLIRPRLALSS